MHQPLSDLRGFPLDARREAGYQLDRVQRALDPDDWRPSRQSALGFARSGFASVRAPSGRLRAGRGLRIEDVA